MARIVHFELPVDNPDRAVGFYTKIFGWKIQKWEGPMEYWLISTGKPDEPGIDGGLVSKRMRPDSGVLVTAEVDSVDDCLAKVTRAGGKIVVPKRAIPGVGYQAHIRDPEGNVMGIMETDPTAK